MENFITKKTLIWIVAIVVVGWLVMSSVNKPAVTEPVAPTAETATTSSSVAKVTTMVKKTAVPVASQPVSLSYQNALALYTDNKRIQLSGDTFCQATPNNVMYKNGTSIMIDNRSSKARTVKVGSTYTIEGYGFKIVTLSSAILPTTLLMDCGSQQNVAKILLQK